MSRKARIDAPGALHHGVARGIERQSIFADNHGRDDFLERLGKMVADSNTRCYWGNKELGLTMTHLAETLGISGPTASVAAQRGERIPSENQYSFIELLNRYVKGVP